MLNTELDDAAPEQAIGLVIKASLHPEVVARLVSALIKTFHRVVASDEVTEISTTDIACVQVLFSEYIELHKMRIRREALTVADEVVRITDGEVT